MQTTSRVWPDSPSQVLELVLFWRLLLTHGNFRVKDMQILQPLETGFLVFGTKMHQGGCFFHNAVFHVRRFATHACAFAKGNMQSEVEGPNIIEVEVTVLQLRLPRFYTLITVAFVKQLSGFSDPTL